MGKKNHRRKGGGGFNSELSELKDFPVSLLAKEKGFTLPERIE